MSDNLINRAEIIIDGNSHVLTKPSITLDSTANTITMTAGSKTLVITEDSVNITPCQPETHIEKLAFNLIHYWLFLPIVTFLGFIALAIVLGGYKRDQFATTEDSSGVQKGE